MGSSVASLGPLGILRGFRGWGYKTQIIERVICLGDVLKNAELSLFRPERIKECGVDSGGGCFYLSRNVLGCRAQSVHGYFFVNIKRDASPIDPMAENFIVNDTEYVQLQEINIRIHRKITEKPVTVWRVYYGSISHNTYKVLLKLEKLRIRLLPAHLRTSHGAGLILIILRGALCMLHILPVLARRMRDRAELAPTEFLLK